jgi:hypothetical protein
VHAVTGSPLFEPLAELGGHPHNAHDASAADIRRGRIRQMYHERGSLRGFAMTTAPTGYPYVA